MNAFLESDVSDQRTFIQEAAAKRGIDPVVIEKDFWVCFVLGKLFSSDYGDHITFKGGTALSKVYRLIDRFSEDIDLTLDKAFINSFSNATSVKPDKISKRCKEVIKEHLLPGVSTMLQDYGTCSLSAEDDQTILFSYESCLERGAADYIKRDVKIELGARGEREPSDQKTVTPYIAEMLPKVFDDDVPKIKVIALKAERTFWEKVTILHSIACQPEDRKLSPRMCRHYHDVYSIMRHSEILESALQDEDLLQQVVQHKQDYFRERWDWYPSAKPGSFRLLPPKHLVKGLKDDYQKTKVMFFDELVSYDTLMGELEQLENRLNKV